MKISKIKNIPLERCYANSFMHFDGNLYAFFASESIGGKCIAINLYNLDNEPRVIWKDKGGTMNFQYIGTDKGFLAIQNFFPGYNSRDSKVIEVSLAQSGIVYRDIIKIPYLHRFGILKSNTKFYFIGATLCTSKKEREDWSDPGKIYVSEYTQNSTVLKTMVIKEGLTKNHGFTIKNVGSHDIAYVSAQEGIFEITPPINNSDWVVRQVSTIPTSEVTYLDFDNDGIYESLSIEPFHGNTITLRKNNIKVWEDSQSQEFIHALWSGEIHGQPCAIIGARKKSADLFILHYDSNRKSYVTTIIDSGVGSANISVVKYENSVYVASSNHTTNNAALYRIDM